MDRCPKTSDGEHVWRQFGSIHDPKNIKVRCFACGKFQEEVSK